MNQMDHDYFEWLTAKIDISNGKTYDGLFELMHGTEFSWTIPNDDNRVQDALDLRNEFVDGRGLIFKAMQSQRATLLEILISLSRRVAFTAGGDPELWAWTLLKNLRLHTKSDPLTRHKYAEASEILESLIWRTYRRDGRGGFFPLNHPEEDQTKIEIWYQMNKYVLEMTSL